jgi:hypothetical protein
MAPHSRALALLLLATLLAAGDGRRRRVAGSRCVRAANDEKQYYHFIHVFF